MRPSFWHQDEDDQRNISPILTGISYLKWRQTHCDGCSFNLILLNNELKQIFPSKVRIFSCSSDSQKSYCRRTFCQQLRFISEQFAWKVGRGSVQFSRQMPNMKTRVIPMLQAVSASPKLYSIAHKLMCLPSILSFTNRSLFHDRANKLW